MQAETAIANKDDELLVREDRNRNLRIAPFPGRAWPRSPENEGQASSGPRPGNDTRTSNKLEINHGAISVLSGDFGI